MAADTWLSTRSRPGRLAPRRCAARDGVGPPPSIPATAREAPSTGSSWREVIGSAILGGIAAAAVAVTMLPGG